MVLVLMIQKSWRTTTKSEKRDDMKKDPIKKGITHNWNNAEEIDK